MSFCIHLALEFFFFGHIFWKRHVGLEAGVEAIERFSLSRIRINPRSTAILAMRRHAVSTAAIASGNQASGGGQRCSLNCRIYRRWLLPSACILPVVYRRGERKFRRIDDSGG